MQLTKEKRGECSILLVHGRLDGTTSPKFETEVLAWLGGGGRSFVLDMAGISFMSSAALRVLLSMAKRVGRTGGKVVLSSPNPVVSEVFEISNFSAMFTICQTLDEGVNAATTGIAASPTVEAAAKPIPVPPVPAPKPVPAAPPPAAAPKAAVPATPPIPPAAPAPKPVSAPPVAAAPPAPPIPPAAPAAAIPEKPAPTPAPISAAPPAPAPVAPAPAPELPKAAVAPAPTAEPPVTVPPPAPIAAPPPAPVRVPEPVAPVAKAPEPPPSEPMPAKPAPEAPRVAAEKSVPRPASPPSIMEAAPTMPMPAAPSTAPVPRTKPAPAPTPAAPPAPAAQPSPLQEPATVAAKPAPAAPPAPKPYSPPKRTGPQKLEVLVGTHIVECRDGDVIGREGTVATHLFKSATSLQPRHLLIGKGPDAEWFIMVPRNVQVVTYLDDAVLTPGVRQPLSGEHRLQVEEFAISLRLSDEGPSSINDSFFSRLMKILHIG